MVCNKCHHKLPDDSEFCQYCGNKLETEPATTTEETPNTPQTDIPVPVMRGPEISKANPERIKKAAVPEPSVPRPPKKPVDIKLVICFTIIPITLIVAVVFAALSLTPLIKYQRAKKLLKDGDYDLAYFASTISLWSTRSEG